MGSKAKRINLGKEVVLGKIEELSEKDIQELVNFIEFLKIREDQKFIDYVNKRTEEALKAKNKGRKFITLQELQKEYS